MRVNARGHLSVVAVAVAAVLALPPAANAASIDSTLTAGNGEGRLVQRETGCPFQPGPFFEYAYSGLASAAQATVSGHWDGFFRIHDNGLGGGYVAPGDGRVEVQTSRGGTAYFEIEGGSCTAPALALAPDAVRGVTASGALALRATFGTGAVRGLSGAGTATISAQLGPAAGNVATIRLVGDFTVRSPDLSIASASARWATLGDFLNKRLTVFVVIRNAGGTPLPGNAYGARLGTAATPGASFTGLPAAADDIPAGETRTATVKLNGAQPNRTYTLNGTVGANDGLDGPLPAIPGSATFKAPLLP